MATGLRTLVHMHCIQDSRFTTQDNWEVCCVSLSLSGNIAVTGGTIKTTGLTVHPNQTSLDVYRNSDSRDKPEKIYSKEYPSEGNSSLLRCVSFVDSYDNKRGLVVVIGLDDKLEVFDLNQGRVLKFRKVTSGNHGWINCLSVREREIFVGFMGSNKITVYDVTTLNKIKSIILQRVQDLESPFDMTSIAGRLLVCVGIPNGKQNENTPMIFDDKNGNVLSELTKPTDAHSYPCGITVCVPLGVVAVVWSNTPAFTSYKSQNVIAFYSLFSANNSSFLNVEIKTGVFRIRISDRGDRMVSINFVTGEVVVYDMAEIFTYSQLKENLTSQLQKDECLRLANFFSLPKDQTDATLKGDTPTENFLLTLEKESLLQPASVDRLTEAFTNLKISSSCDSLVDFYQRTRTSKFYQEAIEELQKEVKDLKKENQQIKKKLKAANITAQAPSEVADSSPDSASSPTVD